MVKAESIEFIISVEKEEINELLENARNSDKTSISSCEETIENLTEIIKACQTVLGNDLVSKLSRKEIVDIEETCKSIIEECVKSIKELKQK